MWFGIYFQQEEMEVQLSHFQHDLARDVEFCGIPSNTAPNGQQAAVPCR